MFMEKKLGKLNENDLNKPSFRYPFTLYYVKVVPTYLSYRHTSRHYYSLLR